MKGLGTEEWRIEEPVGQKPGEGKDGGGGQKNRERERERDAEVLWRLRKRSTGGNRNVQREFPGGKLHPMDCDFTLCLFK